jgi:2-iminobutanoate/2-iminopropanoate deaminase
VDVPLSLVRSHGGLVFVSGQVGRDPETQKVPDSFELQMRQAVANLRAALESAGSTLSRVLKTTVFITDRSAFAEMNTVYAELFEEPYPARSTIVTGLARPELLFEIEAVAFSS